jgi:hypothetical protein
MTINAAVEKIKDRAAVISPAEENEPPKDEPTTQATKEPRVEEQPTVVTFKTTDGKDVEIPERLKPVFDALRAVTKKRDRHLIARWVHDVWDEHPCKKERT